MPRSSTEFETDQNSRSSSSRSRRSTTRVQFSACGACRLRRVKCDLKELDVDESREKVSCTNCLDRGLKCVDVFGHHQAKSIKVRQGRRLQQVRAIYGNIDDEPPIRRLASVPTIQTTFFESVFWRWFSLQHPILDPVELPARLAAHVNGQLQLSKEASLLFAVIVVWAAAFGINECGQLIPSAREDSSDTPTEMSPQRTSCSLPQNLTHDDMTVGQTNRLRSEWKKRCESMTQELMELVDHYGIMRVPTWDGVRVLLMLWPLLAETSYLQSQTAYHMALSQARTLCTNTMPSQHDATVRSKVFWYAHHIDGITSGLRGGKLVFDEDDVRAFQSPHLLNPGGSDPLALMDSFSPLQTPTPEMRPTSADGRLHISPHTASAPVEPMSVFTALPLQISSICRQIHATLSGMKAKQTEEVDSQALGRIWEHLNSCSAKLEALGLNHNGSGDEELNLQRFVAGWQLFVFQCHNIIRDLLKRRLIQATQASYNTIPMLQSMHNAATNRCLSLLPKIVAIIDSHLAVDQGALFKFDAGLVRDACFFAGALVCCGGMELFPAHATSDEAAFKPCVQALEEMLWMFSRSEERIATLHTMWRERENSRARIQVSATMMQGPPPSHPPLTVPPASAYSPAHFSRPALTPLSVPANLAAASTPSPQTASSAGSYWGTYSPPTSSGSQFQGSNPDSSATELVTVGYDSNNPALQDAWCGQTMNNTVDPAIVFGGEEDVGDIFSHYRHQAYPVSMLR